MRPITKILLLLVVAFVVYLLWPRTANMNGFNPTAMANLEVALWQAQKVGKNLAALKARFKIYSSQYSFDPISAFRIAQSQAAALKDLKLSRTQDADPTAENRALQALTEKYTWIKKQAKLDFDADAMARQEISWRGMEFDGAAPQEIADAYEPILAGIYGGDPKDFEQVSLDLMQARAMIFKDAAPEDGSDPAATAKSTVQEAYALLKEIAGTSVPAPAK